MSRFEQPSRPTIISGIPCLALLLLGWFIGGYEVALSLLPILLLIFWIGHRLMSSPKLPQTVAQAQSRLTLADWLERGTSIVAIVLTLIFILGFLLFFILLRGG